MSSWPNRTTGLTRRAGLRRKVAKRLGTAKPRAGSMRELEKRLGTRNAQFVKLRDGQECVQCREEGLPTELPLDAGHLYPKGAFRAGKYLVENLFAQCRRHNILHVRRPEYFMNWYIRQHGFEALDALHKRCTSDWRPDVDWLKAEIEERERQIEELTCHYEAMV